MPEETTYVQKLIKKSCRKTNTSLTEYWEDNILDDLNEIYSEIWRLIVNMHEDYFWTYWTTDIQEWATEYNIQRKEVIDETVTPAIHIPWIAKVKKVYLLVDERYVEIPQLSDLDERLWMKWWTLKDNHIILTRTPEEDIENWLKVEGIQAINELTMESDELDVFPWHEDLLQFKSVLYSWLNMVLWNWKQDFDKADEEEVKYTNKKAEMVRFIAERVQDIYYTKLTY